MSNKDITFKSQEDTFEGRGNKAALENSWRTAADMSSLLQMDKILGSV